MLKTLLQGLHAELDRLTELTLNPVFVVFEEANGKSDVFEITLYATGRFNRVRAVKELPTGITKERVLRVSAEKDETLHALIREGLGALYNQPLILATIAQCS